MDALLRQLSPLAAVVATAVINIVNTYVAKIVPEGLRADANTLVQVVVMAAIIWASNRAVKVTGNAIEKHQADKASHEKA
jgi:predicted phage tail protein